VTPVCAIGSFIVVALVLGVLSTYVVLCRCNSYVPVERTLVAPIAEGRAISRNGNYGMSGAEGTYSGLMPVNLTTLPHFSVSAAI
jgi:hypothetical protein